MGQDCKDVAYNDCQEVHKKVPHQISRRRPFKVCENLNDPYQLQQQDILDLISYWMPVNKIIIMNMTMMKKILMNLRLNKSTQENCNLQKKLFSASMEAIALIAGML